MSTFSSELGCKFPIQLEANHVVGSSQVCVSSLSVGPTNSCINATYRYAETTKFQDEVGQAIYSICEVVPHGVLCFLPSYSMLDKLMNRWKVTGLWGRLCRLKNTFSEPRSGDKKDFNGIMSDFYKAIKWSEDSDCEDNTAGALFLAVCRGKVSEGLDFADNNARAVITVGIPFPNVKDTQVELKRKYNNKYCSTKGLLNGNEWYEIQAYRALNQALGRCIRHRNDWGAILLIDERFGTHPKYRNGLSKWLRNKVVHHNNFHNFLSSLKTFAQARLENPCPNNGMLQTPSGTPKRSTDSSETKSCPESPSSLSSSSQSSQTSETNMTGIKEESRLTTPGPKYPQTTPQLTSHVPERNVSKPRKFQYTPQKPTNQNSAIAHVGSEHNRQNLIMSNQTQDENHLTVNKTLGTPQLFMSTNQISSSTPIVGRGMAPKMLYLTPLNHPGLAGTADIPQRMINPQQVSTRLNNPQQINSPQQVPHAGMNNPVFIQLVSPSGQPVRQALIPGQRVQLVTPEAPHGSQGNNEVFLKFIDGGQPSTSKAQHGGFVQLGSVGEGIRLNMTEQLGYGSTSVVNAGAQGDLQRLTSTPGSVRLKVEAQSEVVRLLSSQGIKEGPLGNHRDIDGKQSSIQRRPLFPSHSSKSTQPDNIEINVDDQHDLTLKCQENISKPLDVNGRRVSKPEGGSPDSPLLFVTPPTSFENNDDQHGRKEGNEKVVGVKSEPMDTTGNENIVEHVDSRDEGIVQKEGGEGVVLVKLEPMDTTGNGENPGEKKSYNAIVGKRKDTAGSKVTKRKKKKNDIDGTAGTSISNSVTVTVKCKACGSTFYTGDNICISDGGKPREEEIPCNTVLGNVLGNLFSLNTNKKKKASTLTTVHVSCTNVLQGCCPAFAYDKEKQNKQDIKLNSIYYEDQCYVSLVCQQCKESARVDRGRPCIIAVRAMPCGSGKANDQSMVWFNRDKVELFQPGMDGEKFIGRNRISN